MKLIFGIILASFCLSTGVFADQSTLPLVSDVGPNSKTWLIPNTNTLFTNVPSRFAKTQTKAIEMATGMHYWGGSNWVKSDPSFQAGDQGFSALTTQHKVQLSSNILTPGAVFVTTADGKVLQSTPFGIALYDTASSNFMLIALITNSTAVQISSNQVLYPNAFSGVCADLVYTMANGSFQQDVVFNGKLDSADYGFPSETTRIQILTEFFDPPAPKMRKNMIHLRTSTSGTNSIAERFLMDQTLGFGQFVFSRGFAFLTETNLSNGRPRQRVQVGKEFIAQGNRHFLVESLPYESAQPLLQTLPVCESPTLSQSSLTNRTFAVATLPHIFKSDAIASSTAERLAKFVGRGDGKHAKAQTKFPKSQDQVAYQPRRLHGLVVDYIATVGGEIDDDFVFQADVTYLITNSVYLYGNTTFEGGAVIKYPAVGGGEIDPGNYAFKGSGYRPIIFTASDDDSVGSSMNGVDPNYTGTVTAGSYGNYLGVMSGTVSNARMSYANIAIDGAPDVMENSQILDCERACFFGSDDTTFNNCLLAYISNFNYGGASMTFNQCTVDNISDLNSSGYVFATNSIFSANSFYTGSIIFAGAYNGFWSNPNGISFGDASTYLTGGLYQSSGAGSYYLVQDDFRNYGTTNIDPKLLAQIRKTTTHPPVPLNTNITVNTTLAPIVSRDTNSSATDLGYHYPPIDYLSTYCQVSNATLTLTNGVVIGYYDNFGVWLENGSTLASVGTPLNRNVIVYYRNVQEQPTNLWNWSTNSSASAVGNSVPMLFYSDLSSNYPNINLTFTTISGANGASWFWSVFDGGESLANLTLTNCELYAAGGQWVVDLEHSAPPVTYKNNLIHRPQSFFSENTNATVAINNLFIGDGSNTTTVSLYCTTSGIFPDMNWNNAFDGCFVYIDGSVQANAYLNSTVLDGISAETNSITTNITWMAGPLGYFYQNTNSPLINAGNLSADQLGLFHYTTTTNQLKETNSIVDIGYHYVALDTNGAPFDTTQDGFSDYYKDSNGNGVYDVGDFKNWLYADSGANGINNTWLISLGLNPHIHYVNNTNYSVNYLYDPIQRLTNSVGMRSEVIRLDADGNITSLNP